MTRRLFCDSGHLVALEVFGTGGGDESVLILARTNNAMRS